MDVFNCVYDIMYMYFRRDIPECWVEEAYTHTHTARIVQSEIQCVVTMLVFVWVEFNMTTDDGMITIENKYYFNSRNERGPEYWPNTNINGPNKSIHSETSAVPMMFNISI